MTRERINKFKENRSLLRTTVEYRDETADTISMWEEPESDRYNQFG
jgi:hypothetical protein